MDSNITFTVKTAGIEEAIAKLDALGARMTKLTINQNGTVTASGKLASTLDKQADSTGKVANATNRASKSYENYIWHITKTTMLSAAVNKAFLMLVDSMGKAVQQVDLMQNFPASMGALGLSTKDASESFLKLRGYIAGIGGDLAEATTSVARFAEVTKNVKAATAEFVGVKNAIIAGGAGTEVQANALEQLIQAYSRGKPQLIEWKTMLVAMPAQLNQVAQAMNYVNAQALGEALTNGEVSMQSFITKLTELSTGTGPIANQAIARMQGIQFATNVMTNTLTNGIAAIYNAIGRSNIVNFFNAVTQVISVLASWVVVLINLIIDLINVFARLFGGKGIERMSGETATVADNLANGAGSAGDLSDGLDDASKSASKLSKSLAPFDKMNVLPDKTSGGSGGGAGTGAGAGGVGLDAGTATELEGIFDGIGGKMQKISDWAKILAGALAALAANKLIEKIFGIDPLKLFFTALGKYVIKPLLGITGTFAKSLAGGLLGMGSGGSGVMGSAAILGAQIGLAVRTGFLTTLSFFGNLLWSLIILPLLFVGSLVVETLSAIGIVAAGVAVPFWGLVAIGAAVVAALVAAIWLIWANWDTVWKFITDVFTNFWNWLVGLWNTLYSIFEGPVKWIWQFIQAIVILLIALLAMFVQKVYEEVVQPIISFFTAMWTAIVEVFKAAWFVICNLILLPIANWVNSNVIQPIINFFKFLWSTVSGLVAGFLSGFKNTMSPISNWVKTNIIDKISGFFSGLWTGISLGLSALMGTLKTIWNGITGVFKTPLNSVVDAFNSVLRSINKIKVPDWVPGIGGKGVNFPLIPKLATGGVIEKATLAMIGENGKEAVVPLENNTEWIDKLASKINSAGGGQPVQLVVQIGEDRIASKIIDLINEKSQMSGRNAILV